MKAMVVVAVMCLLVACKGRGGSSKRSGPSGAAAGVVAAEKIAACDATLRIQVAFPGASAFEVEQGVVRGVEEAIQKVDAVRAVHAYAYEGLAEVVAEIGASARDSARAAAMSALQRVSTFPEDVEPPIVWTDDGDSRFVLFVAHGPVAATLLSSWVGTLRDRLLVSPSVRDVAMVGRTSREIRVEVDRHKLEAVGLRADDVVSAIRVSWLDDQGGARGDDLAKVEVPLRERKGSVQLADVAAIAEGVSERGSARLGEQPAVLIAALGKADAKPGALLEEVGTLAREHARPEIEMDVLGTVTVASCGGPRLQLRGPVLVARARAPGADRDALDAAALAATQLVKAASPDIEVVLVRGDGLLGPRAPAASAEDGFELVGLAGSEKRAGEVADAWRQKLAELPGLELEVYAPGDSRVGVELTHEDLEVLGRAASDMKERLSAREHVRAVESSAVAGAPQLIMRVKDSARELGLTESEVARQVRAAMSNTEVGTIRVGRDLTPVVFRLLPQLDPNELPDLRLLTSRGDMVALGAVAAIERTAAPARIYRHDLRRAVVVFALAEPGMSSSELAGRIRAEDLPELQKQHPGLGAEVR